MVKLTSANIKPRSPDRLATQLLSILQLGTVPLHTMGHCDIGDSCLSPGRKIMSLMRDKVHYLGKQMLAMHTCSKAGSP